MSGLRGNGLVGNAQSIIRKRNLRHWAMMETMMMIVGLVI